MNKFQIDPANQSNAMVNLLAEILAHQWVLAEVVLTRIAEKDGADVGKLKANYEKEINGYKERIFASLLDNFGHLDINELVK